MSRRFLTLLLVLLLVPAVSGGNADDPELDDANDDAQANKGTCSQNAALCDNAMDDPTPSAKGEIEAVWVIDVNETHYQISIDMAAAGDADTEYVVSFNVTPTEDSLPGGADEHTVTFTVTGTTSDDAPGNTTIERNGTDDSILEITLARADTDAIGGDGITAMSVAVTDFEDKEEGAGPATVTRTDTTTDATEGPSRQYNLTRPPKAGDISLIVTGGSITQTLNGTEDVQSFTDDEAELAMEANGTATVTFSMTLQNDGLDPDSVDLTVFNPTGLAAMDISATVAPTTASLDPGQTIAVLLTTVLNGTDAGEHSIIVQGASDLGGLAVGPVTITVPAPPAPPTPTPEDPEPQEEKREPALGLDFLTPAAEGLGLIEPFDEYAELVLLAIILLLIILILFLVIFLATRGSIKVHIEPRTLDVAPGQTAEFHVEVKNKKGKPIDALASFEGDPEWRTSMAFGGHELQEAGVDAGMHLGTKKEPSGVRHGTLKITAPDAAEDKEADRVTLRIAALKDGKARKAQRAQVRVRTRMPTGDSPIRLAAVEHDPTHPAAGEVVETTARIENDSEDEPLSLRVVLNVDGDDLQEQPLVLPPQQARAVVFTWQVPEGSSKVRVRIYQDE